MLLVLLLVLLLTGFPATTVTYTNCTPCCTGGVNACGCTNIPLVLTASVSNAQNCACLAGTYTLTWDGSTYWTSGTLTLCTGNSVVIQLSCIAGPEFQLDIICSGQTNSATTAIFHCPPAFTVTFANVPGGVSCCGVGIVNVTVTT